MTSSVQSGWWHYIHLAVPCPCLQDDCRYLKIWKEFIQANTWELLSVAKGGGQEGLSAKWLKWMLSGKWGCIANSFKSAVDVCLGVRITETTKPACAGFFICLLEGWLIWPETPAALRGSCPASLSGRAGWQPRCCRSFRSCGRQRSR